MSHSVFKKKFSFNLTFGQKIFLCIMAVSFLSILMVSVPMLVNVASNYEKIAEDQARLDSSMISSMIAPSIVFERGDLAEEILKLLSDSDSTEAAVVFTVINAKSETKAFASFGDVKQVAAFVYPQKEGFLMVNRSGGLDTISPIYSDNNLIGFLAMRVSLSEVDEHIKHSLFYMLGAVFFSSFIALYFAYISRRAIVKPIRELSGVTQEIAKTKDYSRRATKKSNDDVGVLIDSFNGMLTVIEDYDRERREREREIVELNESLEIKVEERTAELQESMNILSSTLDKLKETQTKLVEQEKMASLGSLVAGVAHEINTPLGIAITASSHLKQSVSELNKKFMSGSLTKRQFAESVDEFNETVAITLKNLDRAAALVKSFKLVAVDQSNDEMRDFNVHEYVTSILVSLNPKIKNTGHQIVIDAPKDLVVESYPGSISQILTNLIMNSLIHGFENKSEGRIDIKISESNSMLTIDYYDNGKGVPEDMKAIIFDPFVTSARGKGGSGLGTHILYNLVTQVLGGKVVLEDAVTGVFFHICFPVKCLSAGDNLRMIG